MHDTNYLLIRFKKKKKKALQCFNVKILNLYIHTRNQIFHITMQIKSDCIMDSLFNFTKTWAVMIES